MTPRVEIETNIRGPGIFGSAGRASHRDLVAGQHLLLTREPSNPVDPSAVIFSTLLGAPVGYVQRPKSVIVASLLDQGHLLLARVVRPAERSSPGRLRVAAALIWSEGWAENQASTSNENPCLDIVLETL